MMSHDRKFDLEDLRAEKEQERAKIVRDMEAGRDPREIARENGWFSRDLPLPFRLDRSKRLA